MRICFYNVTAGGRSGGLETYCWEAGRALAEMGHEVNIVAGSGGRKRYENVGLVEYPFTERSRFPDLGSRFRKLMERLSFGMNAWRHISDSPYDAVIINKPFDFPAIWRARRRGMKAKVVFRSGGTDFYPGDGFFSTAVDFWVSSSKYNAEQVRERFGRNVTVIHNGVDSRLFYPALQKSRELRMQFGIPDKAFILMSVGRLVGWKGLQTIIEALPGLEQAHFVIIGSGPMRVSLEGLAEGSGVKGRVHFLGAVNHHDLPHLLNQADVFVQPSIGEEAFGISVVEAMACGVPVLASDNGGLPEIVLNGETGLLLPPGEPASWRRAVKGLYEAPEQLRKMGVASTERVNKYFTWASNAERLVELISQEVN